MKKQTSFSKAEQLLARALDECLVDDLSFAPPEREIAREHQFSEDFERKMQGLMEEGRQAAKEQEIQKHFKPRYGQLAACVLVFLICAGMLYEVGSWRSGSDSSSGSESASMDQAAAEAMPEEAPMEESMMEESEEETAAVKEETAAGTESALTGADEQKLSRTVDYCGQAVSLAEEQEVPETLDYVTTLVNCPVLDEENPTLILTIGNIGEEPIRYENRFLLEVWLDGGWYEIPYNSEEEETWETLEAGMAVDVEIDLTQYRIDYNAQQYRLITCVNEDLISAEFTFSDTFEETMEELEEEEP